MFKNAAPENKRDISSLCGISKENRIILSLTASLFFAFNLFFFGPVDLYLANLNDMGISLSIVIKICAVVSAAVFALLFAACLLCGKKVFPFAVSFITGLGTAFYIQGNFFQIGAGLLDGRKTEGDILKTALNILIWLVIIALPFAVFYFRNSFYIKFTAGISMAICLIELITIVSVIISISLDFESPLSNLIISSGDQIKCHSTSDLYTYSNERNLIVILADEYDSFSFDSACETEPDCISGFGGFTYYRNTLGRFDRTAFAVPYLFTGIGDDEVMFSEEPDESFFRTLKDKGYKLDIYFSDPLLGEYISSKYAENYDTRNYTAKSLACIAKELYKLVMYKYSPDIAKGLFWMYSGEFTYEISKSSNVQAYNPDDLAFYNSLRSELEFTDGPCFKLIYIDGLHDPRNIQADLSRTNEREVSGDEQAIAVNKILSAYFDILRKNGIYENAEIVLLADHGIKSNEHGRYPLLAIKRRDEASDVLAVSDAPVSHEDIFPSLVAMAEGRSENAPVFNIDENAERTRYFKSDDEYITGNIKSGDLS